jgi:hypothetical protein
MDAEIQKLLDEGIASLRIGNMEEARRKLMQVINADERNELGWLYLSEAVDNDEDRQICLENALAINPANERAETELKALQEKIAGGKVEEGGLVCPACGATNPPGSLRCLNCYATLDQAIPIPSPSPDEVTVSEPSRREMRHKSFMEMLDTWAEMLALPRQARLDEEHAYARWGLTVPGILIASGISYFFMSLVFAGSTMLLPGSTPDLVQVLPIVCGGAIVGAVGGLAMFLILSGLYYLFARLLQGRGEFVVQSYLLSLIYGPFSLVFGIISPLSLLSVINPVLGFIPTLVSIPISILSLIMWVRALKSTHGYGTGAALGTMFLPGIVLGCICGPLIALLGTSVATLPGIDTLLQGLQ